MRHIWEARRDGRVETPKVRSRCWRELIRLLRRSAAELRRCEIGNWGRQRQALHRLEWAVQPLEDTQTFTGTMIEE